MSKKTVDLPTDATEVAKAKHGLGMRSTVVGTGGGKEVYYKMGGAGTRYHGKDQLVLRKARNPVLPLVKQSSRRKALAGCKNRRGCDFAECVKSALGKVPTNLQKTCGRVMPAQFVREAVAGMRPEAMAIVPGYRE